MATRGGRRYLLVVYTHMINRWYPALLALGLALLALAWAVRNWGFEQWRWLAFGSIGGMILFLGVLLFVFRKSAAVRTYSDHFRLSTPFLHLNISYKRIRKTSTAHMGGLFPPKSVSNWQRGILEPLVKMTAIVVELNALPMSQSTLRIFLSPLFFKDKTPHFVILVDDWMKFSSDLESARTGGGPSGPPSQQQKRNTSSILSRLPSNK